MKSVGGLLMGVLVLLGLRELPKSISSGESETEGKDVFRSLQALPKEPCSASSPMEVFSTDPGMAVPMEIPQSPRSRNDEFAKSSQCNWGGVNSYFLWAMGQAEQDQILRDMQTRGLKMMRIFVSTVPRNFKSTTSQFVPFLEPRLGEFDFTALELINKFMVKVKVYGVKLAIALHDRYELGCWYCDAYHEYLGLTCLAGQPCGPLHLSCACEIFQEFVSQFPSGSGTCIWCFQLVFSMESGTHANWRPCMSSFALGGVACKGPASFWVLMVVLPISCFRNDASKFYRNSTVIKAFDQRLETILNYKSLGAIRSVSFTKRRNKGEQWSWMLRSMSQDIKMMRPFSACWGIQKWATEDGEIWKMWSWLRGPFQSYFSLRVIGFLSHVLFCSSYSLLGAS